MNVHDGEDDETVTAYHESGHAIIGCALGGTIESVSLSQVSAWDDEGTGPHRFGDCVVNWGRVDPGQKWQQQKELLTTLAGPVAEFVYLDRDLAEVNPATWEDDWMVARQLVARLQTDGVQQSKLLRDAVSRLQHVMADDGCWAAIAALADELTLGDEIEGYRVEELVRFWWR